MKDPLRTFKATSKGCIALSEKMKPLRAALKQHEEAFLKLSKLRLKADKAMNEDKVIKLPTCTAKKTSSSLSLDTINLIQNSQDLGKLKDMIAQMELMLKQKGASK
jgi:hypothetical protein